MVVVVADISGYPPPTRDGIDGGEDDGGDDDGRTPTTGAVVEGGMARKAETKRRDAGDDDDARRSATTRDPLRTTRNTTRRRWGEASARVVGDDALCSFDRSRSFILSLPAVNLRAVANVDRSILSTSIQKSLLASHSTSSSLLSIRGAVPVPVPVLDFVVSVSFATSEGNLQSRSA
jgi:hypothetical protein